MLRIHKNNTVNVKSLSPLIKEYGTGRSTHTMYLHLPPAHKNAVPLREKTRHISPWLKDKYKIDYSQVWIIRSEFSVIPEVKPFSSMLSEN